MSDPTCSFEGCERPYYAKGMCRRHYSAAQYAADPERFKARNKASYQRNREKTLARQSAYQKRNRAKQAVKVRRWREKNAELVKQRAREAYAANAAAMREKKRKWREAHIEEVRAREREISALHPERAALKNHRRRQRITANADLTKEQWDSICAEYDGRCAYCDTAVARPDFEHVIPLSRGGAHTASNVVPSCRTCNLKKGSSTAGEFIARMDNEGAPLHGRLSEALREVPDVSKLQAG